MSSGYKKALEARRRTDEDRAFSSMLTNAQTELQGLFHETRSCLLLGAGYGQRDVEFIKRSMPVIESLIAIEPLDDCVAGLMATLQVHLPNVRSTVHQEKVQQWKGVEHPVDAALMFHFIYQLIESDRRQLMERLFKEIVQPRGHVVLLTANGDVTTKILKRINSSYIGYTKVETFDQELRGAGFHECFHLECQVLINMIPPYADKFVEFFGILLAYGDAQTNVEDVRANMEREFSAKEEILPETWHLIVYGKQPDTQ